MLPWQDDAWMLRLCPELSFSHLLELGRDFAFLGRQYRITVGGRHHFIDLLFFHRRLRCLVAIDLKIGAFGQKDAGQMNFYLNYPRENVSLADEDLPVGIVLCADKDAEEAHYATGKHEACPKIRQS